MTLITYAQAIWPELKMKDAPSYVSATLACFAREAITIPFWQF